MAYRLYDERYAPQLGQDDGFDWSGLLQTATTEAVSYAQSRVQADTKKAAADAQAKATKAQLDLLKQQTLLQQAKTAALAHPVATGTIAAVAVGGLALLYFLKKGKR